MKGTVQRGVRAAFSLVLLWAALTAPVQGQVRLDSGGLDVTMRFEGYTPNDPANPDCGVEELLLEGPWSSHFVWATSLGSVRLVNIHRGLADPDEALSDSYCLTVQALDPLTGDPGVAYEVSVGTTLGLGADFYNWVKITTDPVEPFEDPVNNDCADDPMTLPVLLEECPGIARVRFVEAEPFHDNDPHVFVAVEVSTFDVRGVEFPLLPRFAASLRTGGPWQSGSRGWNASSTFHATRGDMNTWIAYEVSTGSDYNLDTFRFEGMAVADGPTPAAGDDSIETVIPCDKIRDFSVPLLQPGDEGLSSVSGLLDVIGETEACERPEGFDLEITGGPSDHGRGAKIGTFSDADQPCDTTRHPRWVLRNLHGATYSRLTAVSWLRDYSVKVTWPRVGPILPSPPALGPGLDLGDTFVSRPGLVRGRVRLTTGDPGLDGLKHMIAAGPGPNSIGDLARPWVTVQDMTTSFGLSDARWDRDARFDDTTGTYEAGYEAVVVGLHGEDWPWRVRRLSGRWLSHPESEDLTGVDPSDYIRQEITINEQASVPALVPMGGAPVVRDLEYCFGRLTVLFESTVPFRDPTLASGGRLALWPPSSVEYSVLGSMNGTPRRGVDAHALEGQVTGYLPQAQGYDFTATVRTIARTFSELPIGCDIDVGCGQDIRLDGPLTLNVEAPQCSESGSSEVWIDAETFLCDDAGPGEVTELRWENLTTGDGEIVCSGDCAGEHSFVIDGLAPCENRIRVTAIDNSDPPRESTNSFAIFGATDPPSVVGGCPALIESGPVFEGLEWIDACGGEVEQDCVPAIGTVLDEGLYPVTCTAFDGCNSASCTTILEVSAGSPPDCEAGPDVLADCDGVRLGGTASDPDGDPLTVAWTSNCSDTVFEPSAEILDPFVSFGSNCEVDCQLTLLVSDGEFDCSDTVQIMIDDRQSPTVDCSVSAADAIPDSTSCSQAIVLECTGPQGAEATVSSEASDNCGSVSLSNDRPGHEDQVEFTDWFSLGCGSGQRTDVTVTATDDCDNASTCCVSITVQDTSPPVLSGCPTDVLVSCPTDVPPPAGVTASDICDPNPELEFTESIEGEVPCDYTVTRTWTATDSCGNATSCSRVITVRDTEGPAFTQQPSFVDEGTAWLWPPQHGYVDFDLADTGAVAEDDCGGPVTLRFADCRSSQPENDLGDGNSVRDCVISPDGQTVSLRAERSGNCAPVGRAYPLTLLAEDECGNDTPSEPFGACVPHDRRRPGGGRIFSAAGGSNQVDRRLGSNGTYGEDCGQGCADAD